jgi:hypothetical protein
MRTDPAAVQRRRDRNRKHNKEPRSELANDLLLGAELIAQFVYGEVTEKTVRDVYRNVLQLPLFKHGNTLAGLKSAIVAEIKAKPQRAQEKRRRDQVVKARKVKPRRRIHPRRGQDQVVEAA